LFRLARIHRIALIGGDLSAGDRFLANIVVLGAARRGRTLERANAKVGHILYVSGRLGGSALGLQRLLSRRSRPQDRAVHRHLYPTPRLALGRFLAEKLRASAAIDLSDGVSIDLYRLMRESGLGAEVLATAIPVFSGSTFDQALHGGEDYELLFAVSPLRQPPARFEGIPLTPIGTITAGRRLTLVAADGRKKPLPIRGFQHKI
jgi:thiamine-monophosphate kinase